MTTITLDDELNEVLKLMAAKKHQAVERLVHDALIQMVEDYEDTQAAETALADIESGKEQLLDWRDVKSSLYDLDH